MGAARIRHHAVRDRVLTFPGFLDPDLFAVAWILHVAGAPDALCHGLATAVILLGAIASIVLAAVVLSGSTAAFPDVFSWLGKYHSQVGLTLYVVAAVAFFLLPFSGTEHYKAEFGRLRTDIGEWLKSGGGMLCFAISPLVVYLWSKVRYFLREFIGDVAIYVSAYPEPFLGGSRTNSGGLL